MISRRNRRLLTMTAFVSLVTSLLLFVDISIAVPNGVFKQAIHWNISGDWLDPATTINPVNAHFPLYFFHDALLKPMPEGTYTPCLAESWAISPDSRVYEFRLRKGVKFHNGDTMTAEDVVFSFWRYKAALAKFIHDKTDKVEAVNPHLVRIYFKEPFPDFLEYLVVGGTTIGWVVPKKYVEKVGEAGFKKHPVGAGPYKFVEFVAGVKIVGEAFEEFWRKKPHVKRIESYSVADVATRLAMVRRGEVDVDSSVYDVFYEDAKKDPKLRVIRAMSPSQFLVYMTSQWDPKSPWSDVRVRKAASLAIDRQSLADIHQPGGSPLGSLGLEGDPLAVHFPADSYAPEEAKKLLAEAGYPKGFHGGKLYPVDGRFWPVGEQIANYWKTVGITVETVLLDKPAWYAHRQGGKMKGGTIVDLAVAPTIGSRLSYLFGPASYGNYPDIQRLWDQYQKEVSPNGRKDLIARVQKLIHEKIMWIPVFSGSSNSALGPRVKGNPYKIQPPKSFPIWFIVPFEDIELIE